MIFVFCGPAGSGKTTLSKVYASKENTVRLSFDEMKCFQHKDLISSVRDGLLTGKNIVVDALYTEIRHRIDFLSAVADIPCKRILIVMDTPLEECLRRNAGRANPLPDFVVESIYKTFERPALDEGWDEIMEVKTYESDFGSYQGFVPQGGK